MRRAGVAYLGGLKRTQFRFRLLVLALGQIQLGARIDHRVEELGAAQRGRLREG
jgi:hypothetical protein